VAEGVVAVPRAQKLVVAITRFISPSLVRRAVRKRSRSWKATSPASRWRQRLRARLKYTIGSHAMRVSRDSFRSRRVAAPSAPRSSAHPEQVGRASNMWSA